MIPRRMTGWSGWGWILLSGLAWAGPLTAQTYTATPIPSGSYATNPYYHTGLITTPKGQGSGAVVKNPRVVYSCAHVVFDTSAVDPWLSSVRWYRTWASGSYPPASSGQLLRSYYYYVGYAAAALSDQASNTSFSLDFVVHYAYENTANGGWAGWWNDGVSQLKTTGTKLITGYPSGNYASGDTRKYLMHSTGPFTRAFTTNTGDFLTVSEASTGPGNSGGPAWVSDGTQYYFAGVLVSGLARANGDSTDIAGVYGVDASSAALIDLAITAGGGTVAAPAITTQPTSRRVSVGQSASFTVVASGPGLSYRWLFNGVVLSGATSASLTLSSVGLASAGTYQVVVSNAGGETRSTTVTLAVDSGSSRLSNLSVRIGAGTGDNTLIVGFVVGGDGTSGTKPLLIRAVGPTLASYGVTGTLVDPALELIAQGASTALATNDNWGGDGQVTAIGNTVGAFPLSSAVSKDAALYLAPASGAYTAKVTGVGGTTGIALAEIYDASSTSYTVSTPRLINVSARAQVGTGEGVLIAGFVVDGTLSRTVLIRAVGPTLGVYGVGGVLADPQLELTKTVNGATVVVAANDNWAGDAQITSVGVTVGAFALASVSSKDAAILVTLPPGVYSAKASGVGNSIGVALIEVYEAP